MGMSPTGRNGAEADEEHAAASRGATGDARTDSSPETYPGFHQLFDRNFGALVGLARLLGSDDPEDIAAEAFVRLHQEWSRLSDPKAAVAYARTTVVRLCSNRRRHLAVVRRYTSTVDPDPRPAAESLVLQHLRRDEVLGALRQLPVRRRIAIVLRYYAQLPFAEIADALRCTESTARSHVRRGLDDLRRVFGEEGDQV